MMVRQTFSLVPTCQHSKDHMWIWLKWPHNISSTIYTFIETHHYSTLFAPPRLPPASRDCHFGPLIYFYYMIEDVYLHGLVITVCFMQSNHQITELYNKSVSPAKKVVLLF